MSTIEKHEIGFDKQNIAMVFKSRYTVPSYQRHYVWDSDQVNDLLTDFIENYQGHPNDEYFLGSYIYQDKGNELDLLDGQQRITTLFLLFAFLRDFNKTPDDIKNSCKKYVYQEGNAMECIDGQVRLNYAIRGNVNQFINDYIVNKDITTLWETFHVERETNKNESIRHICNSLLCIKVFFESNPSIDIKLFAQYICLNVVMIYVSAKTLEDAFRLFSIMNDRGLKLSNSDILKSSNLEKITKDEDRNTCANQWEKLQSDLGTDFDRFLSYIRMTLLKSRQRTTLLDEFEKLIFDAPKGQKPILQAGKPFFDYIEKSYAGYNKVIELDEIDNTPFCNLISALKASMPSTDWIPVVMHYYFKFGETRIYDFTHKTACKYLADSVCGDVPTTRINHLSAIMKFIDIADSANSVIDKTSLFSFDTEKFLGSIQSDVYGRKYTKALLMLLELDVKDKSQYKDWGMISIEHILPQTPNEDSQWVKDFSTEQRFAMTHKVGNLCLIGRSKNSSLGNLDYLEKRKRYFEKNIGMFPHTLQIYNTYQTKWTPVEFEENQKNTINQLKKIFGI